MKEDRGIQSAVAQQWVLRLTSHPVALSWNTARQRKTVYSQHTHQRWTLKDIFPQTFLPQKRTTGPNWVSIAKETDVEAVEWTSTRPLLDLGIAATSSHCCVPGKAKHKH